MDGTNTIEEIIELAVAGGAQPFPKEVFNDLLGRLDEVLLLANGAYNAEIQKRLREYREAPARKPALADLAYPGKPDDLRACLDGMAFPYMSSPTGQSADGHPPVSAPETPQWRLKAIVSPHIDFERGGDSYGMIWEQVRDELQDVELFVVFRTDHNADGPRLTLTEQNYASPIGELETDRELARELAAILTSDTTIENHAFADEFNHLSEHSIELATVWLHRALGRSQAKMLPVLCGSFGRLLLDGAPNPDAHPRIGAAIAQLEQVAIERRTVFVAAADLSHVGPAFGDPDPVPATSEERERVQADDERLLAAIARGDRRQFFDQIRSVSDANKVCGLAPIYMTLWAAGASTGVWNGYRQCQADEDDTSFVSIAGAALYG
jgi:hypothetical protein